MILFSSRPTRTTTVCVCTVVTAVSATSCAPSVTPDRTSRSAGQSQSTPSTRLQSVNVVMDLPTMKKRARVIAVVDGIETGSTTWTSKPVPVDPSDPEYPYAPGYTPTDLPSLPMATLRARVVESTKGGLEPGEMVTIRYLDDDVEAAQRDRTPAGARYFVFAVPGGDGFYDPVAGSNAVFTAGSGSRGKAMQVFRPITAGGAITQIELESVRS